MTYKKSRRVTKKTLKERLEEDNELDNFCSTVRMCKMAGMTNNELYEVLNIQFSDYSKKWQHKTFMSLCAQSKKVSRAFTIGSNMVAAGIMNRLCEDAENMYDIDVGKGIELSFRVLDKLHEHYINNGTPGGNERQMTESEDTFNSVETSEYDESDIKGGGSDED